MTFVLGLLIVIVALYLIAAPYLDEPIFAKVSAKTAKEDEMEKRKESIFTTLNELEFDHRMKKISDEDYNVLKNQYKSQAASVLKSEEDLGGLLGKKQVKVDADTAKEIEDEIENQIANLRNKGDKA